MRSYRKKCPCRSLMLRNVTYHFGEEWIPVLECSLHQQFQTSPLADQLSIALICCQIHCQCHQLQGNLWPRWVQHQFHHLDVNTVISINFRLIKQWRKCTRVIPNELICAAGGNSPLECNQCRWTWTCTCHQHSDGTALLRLPADGAPRLEINASDNISAFQEI